MSDRQNVMDYFRQETGGAKIATAAVVAGLGLAAFVGNKLGGGEDAEKAALAASANVACEQIEGFEDFSTNSANYKDKAFLPEADNGIDSSDEAKSYIEELYQGEDGPFGQETDAASLAAMVSVVTEPARDGKPADPNYNYVANFEDNMSAYGANGGVERAQDDCADTAKTLNQVTSYDEQWAAKGEKVTQIIATRNADNEIVGMRLAKKVVGEDGLSGAALELPDSNNDLDGFTEVLIDEDGNTYVKGITVDNNKNGEDKKQKGKSQKDKKDNKGQTDSDAKDGAGGTGNSEGESQGTNGRSDECGGTCGEEGGQQVGPGSDDGCGGGCGDNKGGPKKTPENPGQPKPPVTPPAEETPPTVTTPPAEETPPTEEEPPVKPPITCDPNIDVC